MNENNFNDLEDTVIDTFASKVENETIYKSIHINKEKIDSQNMIAFDIERNEICDECNGTGVQDKINLPVCEICNGKGKKIILRNIQGRTLVDETTCNNCLGRGKVNDRKLKNYCNKCNGFGVIKSIKSFSEKLPENYDKSIEFFYKGEGDINTSSDIRGDLKVMISID